MKQTINELSKLLRPDNNFTGDYSFYGVVQSAIIDSDNKVTGYNVEVGDSLIEARKLAGADIGDVVLCTTLSNGITAVTGRVGGDGDVLIIQDEVDELSGEISIDLDEIYDIANQANQIAGQANQTANTANQTANTANQTANQANQTANLADQTATNAVTIARDAQSTANTANQTANQANTTANAANTTANNVKKYFFHDSNGTHMTTEENDADTGYSISETSQGVLQKKDGTTLFKVSEDEISASESSGSVLKILNKDHVTDEKFTLLDEDRVRLGYYVWGTSGNYRWDKYEYEYSTQYEDKTDSRYIYVTITTPQDEILNVQLDTLQVSDTVTTEQFEVQRVTFSDTHIITADITLMHSSVSKKITVSSTTYLDGVDMDGLETWLDYEDYLAGIKIQIDAFEDGTPTYAFSNEGANTNGKFSIISGTDNVATGDFAIANGLSNTASGDYSVVNGYHSTASGKNSYANGLDCVASGDYSVAIGKNSTAGDYSVAIGENAQAAGEYIALGKNGAAIALGKNSKVSGGWAAIGDDAQANSYNRVVIGPRYYTSDSYQNTRELYLAVDKFGVDRVGRIYTGGDYETYTGKILTARETVSVTSSNSYDYNKTISTIPAGQPASDEMLPLTKGNWLITYYISCPMNSSGKLMKSKLSYAYSNDRTTKYDMYGSEMFMHTSSSNDIRYSCTVPFYVGEDIGPTVQTTHTPPIYLDISLGQNSGSTKNVYWRISAVRLPS